MSQHGVALEISGLTKRYGDVTALAGVDLSVAPGEFITFLGPSGSGKTTTLNAIAGFIEPDEGTIDLDGRSITGVPPWKRDIGVVFQNYSLFPHMKVSSNVAFPLRQRRVPKREMAKKVDEVLEIVGLSHLADRYPRQLSGGQQQRVALARALVFGPKLLLLDEPLGALDKRLREGLQLEIKRIHREVGVTFVFVTHDQDEALVMSDRIAVFNEGHLEQVATSQELYEHPETLFAAQFLGDSNVIHGTLENSGDRHALRVGDRAFEIMDPRGAAPGSEVAMMIRPEDLVVRPVDRESPVEQDGKTTLAEVTEVIYLGGRRRIVLSALGQEFIADEMSGVHDHQPGDPVVVTWSMGQARLVSTD